MNKKRNHKKRRTIRKAVLSGVTDVSTIEERLSKKGLNSSREFIERHIVRSLKPDPLIQHFRLEDQPYAVQLKLISRTPIEKLRLQHFVDLKVGGRDCFSCVGIKRLKRLVPDHDLIVAVFASESEVASCLRWVLRGLSVEKAISKVLADADIFDTYPRRGA